MKYRKKPVVIEAWRNDGSSDPPSWLLARTALQGSDPIQPGAVFGIMTLEGLMTANTGDWIIQGIKGEIYPCRPDIFEATYEPFDKPRPTIAELEDILHQETTDTVIIHADGTVATETKK